MGAAPGAFTVEEQCPQCGAPVNLEESDRLLACRHCRARLFIARDDIPRYCLPPSRPDSDELHFVPYWHLRGSYFSVATTGVYCRVFDKTFRAAGPGTLPPTLGVRAQAMKLRHAAEDVAGRFLLPSLDYGSAAARVEAHSRTTEPAGDGGARFRSFITGSASLIYAPFTLKGDRVYDAVLDRPQSRLPEEEEGLGPLESGAARRVEFLAALCPNCGWDLPGSGRSAVFTCARCSRAWRFAGRGFHEVPFAFLPGGGEETVYLPFWKMTVEVEGLALRNFADLARLANLPRAVKKEWEAEGPHFWAPAFSLRPRVFLRLTTQFSSLPPLEEKEGTLSGLECHPATVDAPEAFESVRLTIASLAVPRRRFLPLLSGLGIKPVGAVLVLVPFTVRGGDYIQGKLGISLRRNALRP